MSKLINKTIARTEAFMKGMMFDCHVCGQCVLDKTHLICPMSCPKGLRNGPCGGTLHGECEVYPDKPCVWVNIHKRREKKSGDDFPGLIRSPDARLFNTSSWLNKASGADEETTAYLPYPNLPRNRKQLPPQTDSGFEAALKSGKFVFTTEIRAPREPDLSAVRDHAQLLAPDFDAVNCTAYLNGKPSLPSPLVARELRLLGVEAICQSTCRDHTKTSFISELIENGINGVHNTLCLTGDSYVGIPKIKQVFDMDSALMIYEARHLREYGTVHFSGQSLKQPPRTFIGGAINPFTEPPHVPIRRLSQKAAAGADFIQTQLVFDMPRFADFVQRFRDAGLDRELFLLAGVPVVISKPALAFLPKVPGVWFPPEARQRLESAEDIRSTGMQLAAELIAAARQIDGVSGVHLMLFGADHSVLPELAGAAV
jgi:methylenetetrahydrofolate reductase (NADPH)